MSYINNSSRWNLAKQRLLIQNFQQNMEEFTLIMTQKIDFSTFDVLSITRTDVQPSVKQQTKHAKVNREPLRFALQTAQIIPLPIK